ncbi:polynucleotide 5'-hydroxyl-kinase NOL9 [Danaus plexippus]|uniref:polynucleotide 5'-hydroxyl-kinase NOL9 n=1 Tax=Danaus plexippus TaxID=13037 RepID=UPI002AB2328D|nr:polynucleotide 5'-hydroxyl-kinase NOL9 [Danaus plexippus]
MEFFEKAHVACSNATSLNNKSKKNVKKQLKQMLHGYKQSDIHLIKSSALDKTEYDSNSTSVSGYSDLNLTDSGDDEHSTRKELVESVTVDENDSLDRSASNTIHKVTSYKSSEISASKDKNSITEESDDVFSLVDSEASNANSLIKSESESNSSEPFDPDGLLAAKIIQRLQINNEKKKNLKRKHDIESKKHKVSKVIESKSKSVKGPVIPSVSEEVQQFSDDDSSVCAIAVEKDSSEFSPPYVSISAVDVPLLSFTDVLGDYKHTTIKNIPSQQKSVTADEYSNFIIDKSLSVDAKVETDIGSLTPEPSSDNEIGEIEEIINLDSTTETIETDTPIPTNVPFDDTMQSEPLSDKESSTDEDYYKVIDTFKIYYGNKCCIIILKHPTELFVQGKVAIKVLDGSIDIFGYTPKDDTCKLYAPFYSYAHSIKTTEEPNDYYGLFGKLTEAGLSVAEAEEIVITIGEHDGVVLLKPLVNQCLDFVENNFKITNLFVRSVKNIEPFFTKATDILNCSLFSIRPARCFKVHPSWKEALKYSQEKHSRGIICGGKGAGKSTYLRYQVNKLISQGPVLVVDLDPGQSEFTVAGGISATTVSEPLLGPSFTHLKKPDIMFNIGMINTMDNARRYVAALQQLLSHCRNHKPYSEMPWIVNTMGMTNFLGLKFITLIVILTQPTYLLQYESKNSKRRFESFLRPSNVKLVFQDNESDPLFSNITFPEQLNYKFVVADEADSFLKNGYSLSPRDERYLNFLAYFGQLLTVHKVKSLLEITPYQVNLKDINVATNVIVMKERITKVINGQIVALCQLLRQCDNRVFTLDDKPFVCYGYGIVRGVDWDKEVLYIITPLEGDFLACVDTLVYADWSPELVGLETCLPSGTSIPYRTYTRNKHIQLMSTPKRRFNPLQLIKMTRNA